jgi:hypothetical protein
VIGPGSLPRLRPLSAMRKRTLAYTRVTRFRRIRRHPRAAHTHEVRHPEIVIFDRSSELPRATLVASTPLARVRAWLSERWLWLSPRAVPVLVATVGMLLVLISADYLAHFHGDPAAHYSIRIVAP